MASDITKAIQALCVEKNLSEESVMETIELALAAAYRKDFGIKQQNKQQNVKVKFDAETGDMKVWDEKIVVADIDADVLEKGQNELLELREAARADGRELSEEETAHLPKFNSKTEIMLSEAQTIEPDAELGDVLEIPLEIPRDFGRMAAQTAKQVIIQKIREAERNLVFGDFKNQEGEIVMGTVQRAESRKVLIDLGKITALLPPEEQSANDKYRPGSRMKFLVRTVAMGVRGPEVIVSRAHPDFVKNIFMEEIPEVTSGVIQVKGVAREAGFRSKVAVFTADPSIDPIGSCIGQRGSRITTIIEELGGEKIDVVEYSSDEKKYILHALSPAKATSLTLDETNKTAEVLVPSEQFSLAIGRGGQNVRLASELTGWKINVREDVKAEVPSAEAESASVNSEENDEAPEESQEGTEE